MPDEFNYDPVSKTYGEPQRRPEVRSSTIEFIAPQEYMVSARSHPQDPAKLGEVGKGAKLHVLCEIIDFII